MKKIIPFFLLAASSSVFAAPMAPKDEWIKSNFSPEVVSYFKIFSDSELGDRIYYVPRFGTIADLGGNGLPAFGASYVVPSTGFFAGEQLVRFGGSFSTLGYKPQLKKLFDEAASKGYTAYPAPVDKQATKTRFFVGGTITDNGRVDLTCEKETLTNSKGKEYTIPHCFLFNDKTKEYDLETNVVSKLISSNVNSSTADATLSFQALSTSANSNAIGEAMQNGRNWSDLFFTEVEWTIPTEQKSYRADLIVHWKRLFEQLDAYAAIHNNACVDVEVKYFMQKVLGCEAGNECGVDVLYWVKDPATGVEKTQKTPPSNADFLAVVEEARKKLQDELFNKIEAFDKPVLGRVDQSSSAVFTLKANYEKRTREENDKYIVQYNPGKLDVTSTTTLQISCLSSDGPGTFVSWNKDRAECKQALGLQ